MINYFVNKGRKLAQKEYKTKHLWLQKVIPEEEIEFWPNDWMIYAQTKIYQRE